MRFSLRQKLTIALFLLLLILSAVSNAILLKELHESFVKLQFSRIFPLGYVPSERLNSNGARAGSSIAFWGDSRAYMWDKSALGLIVYDNAHGGITSAQLVLQLRTQSLNATDYAVVQIGINDLHPLGAFGIEKKRILDQLRQNITLVRDALLARSQIVVFTTLFPPGRVPISRRKTWDPDTLRYVDEINQVIRQSADGQRVILLDAHALLSDSSHHLASEFVDSDFFLHVNGAAYARLNERLQQIVLERQSHFRK